MVAVSEETQASLERVNQRIDHLNDRQVAMEATLANHGHMIERNGDLMQQLLTAMTAAAAVAVAVAVAPAAPAAAGQGTFLLLGFFPFFRNELTLF